MSSFSAGAVGTRAARAPEALGLSRTRLAWLQATHRRGWALALWVCMVGTIALTAILPLVNSMAVESALSEALLRDGILSVQQDVSGADAFAAFRRDVDSRVSARLGARMVPLAAYVTAGPLYPVTLNGEQTSPPLGDQSLTAAFQDHLASHVDVVAGRLPPDALGGGETAVTLPQSAVNQLGLHLSDRFCVDFAATGERQPRWCARIVGIWQPLDARDPYWAGQVPRLQLDMGQYDFFQLARLRLPRGPAAGVLYFPDTDVVDAEAGPGLAQGVRELSADLPQQSRRRVRSNLPARLDQLDPQQAVATAVVHLFAGGVALLGFLVVALVAARFLDGQARELAVLRARGWSSGRVWRVAFLGFGALALVAVPSAVAICLLLAALLTASGLGVSALSLHVDDLEGAVAAGAVATAGVVAVLAYLAAVIARREVWPPLELSADQTPVWWQRRDTAIVLIILGMVALVVGRLPGIEQLAGPASEAVRGWLPALPALGILLLTAAAIGLRPPASSSRPARDGVADTLAGWQLGRCPEQHAAVTAALTMAAALGTYAVVGVALGRPVRFPSALGNGIEAALLVGFVGLLALVLIGYWFHFRSVTQRRLLEYGGLFAHGLPVALASRSLRSEQAAVAGGGIVAGLVLGLVLTVANLPLPAPTGSTTALAAAGVVVFAVSLLGVTALVGSFARRLPARVNPFQQQRQQS